MAELGRMDIETRWLAHTLRFWNSLCAQPPNSLHHQLLLDAQTEALLAGTRNWVWGLRQACQRLGYQVLSGWCSAGGRAACHGSGGGTAATGMGGSQRMPTDMPERGRSQVHILEVVCTHAAATGTLADFSGVWWLKACVLPHHDNPVQPPKTRTCCHQTKTGCAR